jgi:hypothetical protein
VSNVALFACGVVVTLLALAGIALLVVGAVLDGRDEQATRLLLLESAHTPARPDPLDTALPPSAA